MRATLLLSACLLTAALAGCAVSPGATSEQFTLSRQIRVHFDSANIESGSENIYDYVETAFVVHINGDAIAPAAATIVYQDETGAIVSKPLTAFTTLATLPKGTEVRIGDANLTSSASLLVAGVEVVSRARPHTDWWNVGGYPIGVKMDPGAALGYKMLGSASETFTLTDIRGSTPETDDFVLDTASMGFAMKYDGTLDLGLASAPSSVVAEKEHSAFPLEWKSAGKLTLPINAEATGRNLTSGQAITAGFALTPTSGVDFDANGKLWWNVSGSPVRADISGGSWRSQGDATAWLTGIPELEGTFSCAGKAKAENCHPTEIPETATRGNGTIPAESVNLDNFPWDVKPDVLANVTRFLDEDLVPGDELRIDVDIDSAKMKDYQADGGPETLRVTGGAVLKAVAFESVTVGAGTFEALKLVERVDMHMEFGAIRDEDKVLVKPFVLEQRFIDTTMWLQKDTFVPLRIEQSMPIDLNKMIDTMLDNLGEGTWDDSPIEPLTGKNIDATVEGTSSIELVRNVPGTRFSPYVVIAGLRATAFLPALAAMGGMGEDSDPYGDMPMHDGSDGYDMPPYDMYDYGEDGGMHKSRDDIALGLASAGPVVGGVQKDVVVTLVSDGVMWGALSITINDEYLGYGEELGSWCLVDAGTDACVDAMEGFYATVSGGDTIRLWFEDIQGSALSVYGDSEDPIATLTL